MIKFSTWLESRDIIDLKKTVISSLFPSLDRRAAEDNLMLPMDSLDDELIDQMLQNGEIRDRLSGRNPKHFINSKEGLTVNDFINWLADANAKL